MTWSDLTQIIEVSPNCSSRDGRKVERITVHHTAGKASAQGLLNIFANPARGASANYVIGNDGTIGGCVPEEYRAWTSGSWENDTRAITIEVSNDVNGEPWSIGKKAWNSAVNLCADICLRYGFRLWWMPEQQTGSLTCHRWYQATACPGDWFYERIPQFIIEVNKMIDRITTLEKRLDALQGTVDSQAKTIAAQGKTITEQGKKIVALEADVKSNTNYINLHSKDLQSLNAHVAPRYHTVSDLPSWAKPTVKKLVDRGDLKGTSEDDLGLNLDTTRVLVITDRAGGFDK